jgi:glycosyltransferase involved in cell wall biosynthesis
MKLLLLSPAHTRGGAEEYALTIGAAAVGRGWNVHAAFPRTPDTQSLAQDFRRLCVTYHPASIAESPSLRIPGRRGHVVRLVETARLLFRIRPHVVHLDLPWITYSFGSILACALFRIPTVVTFQLAPFEASISPWQRRLSTWARSRGQRWVAVSKNNRAVVSALFRLPQEDIACIYNGVRLPSPGDQWSLRMRSRPEVLKEFGLDDSARLILTVGRLSAQKGYNDLIPAIPHILKEFPDARFLWLGDGEDRIILQERLRDYGIATSVSILGHRRDVQRFLSAADLFVFPSRFEGFPFALLEAVAHGVPVVASDASSVPEILSNRIHALLFRSGDSCDLLETLRYALRHPGFMYELSLNAMSQARIFDEERMVRDTLDLLEESFHQAKHR